MHNYLFICCALENVCGDAMFIDYKPISEVQISIGIDSSKVDKLCLN